MNQQQAEKRQDGDGQLLDVHSIFDTIQGEGPFTGRPAVFVRLAGCNLACPLCDTDYTSSRQPMLAREIAREVMRYRRRLVVITGGEPFRQNIEHLVRLLLMMEHCVQIETNGTLPPPSPTFSEMVSTDTSMRNRCFVVCSPKTGSINHKLLPLVCAYKYVLRHDSVGPDGLPVRALDHRVAGHVARPPSGFKGPVYLQPCDDKNEGDNHLNLKACIKSVQRQEYILQLQIHKIINVE